MEKTCIVLYLTNNILIIVIINGARSILRIRCATASLRLPSPFVRFITQCVILVHKYIYKKEKYINIYVYTYIGLFMI